MRQLRDFWNRGWWSKGILIVISFLFWPAVLAVFLSSFILRISSLYTKIVSLSIAWLIAISATGGWVGELISITSGGQNKETLSSSVEVTQQPFTPTKTPALTSSPSSTSTQTSQPIRVSVKVIKVIDGDTIVVEGGTTVRYLGINTPETHNPRKGGECFGEEAKNKNKELVEGKIVQLEKDVSETDKYGRLLRYVYIGNIFINDYLVRQGYAHATSYPPDVAHQGEFREAEQEARENNRGLWSVCKSLQ